MKGDSDLEAVHKRKGLLWPNGIKLKWENVTHEPALLRAFYRGHLSPTISLYVPVPAPVASSGTNNRQDAHSLACLRGFILESYLSYILFGVVTVQAYLYSFKCMRDAAYVKYLAFIVWALQVVQFGILAQAISYYTVTHFGNMKVADNVVWSAPALILIEVLEFNTIKDSGRRSRPRPIAEYCHSFGPELLFDPSVDMWVHSIPRRNCAIRPGILFYYRLHSWISFHDEHHSSAVYISGLAAGMVADTAMAGALAYYIYQDRTGFRSMDSILHWMILFTVNTGALTVATGLVNLLVFIYIKHSLVFLGFAALSSKLYANSLFAILNARHKSKPSTVSSSNPTAIQLSAMSSENPSALGREPKISPVFEQKDTMPSCFDDSEHVLDLTASASSKKHFVDGTYDVESFNITSHSFGLSEQHQ
ncbi:hypothetical protein EIP91_007296 [Steccherinum ochraceum]|uniref:DUF6534 domain-containing protein n=1 Tax=Steccherinum ochraceum TaxID=92696 RepID=A0A4R0RIL5_9APHY|nr:hypothetical protein EIP91_007296 [Steccherinum ochraceum]